jgi:transposase
LHDLLNFFDRGRYGDMNATSFPHDWKEARRFRALELKQAGWTQQEIAEVLGVTKGAVSQWMTAVADDGMEALYARPHPGGPVKLPFAQRQLIPELLSHGAEAYGFRGEVWTCARVAEVIKWEFRVAYHPAHVSRILKDLKWTPQKPIERASQRNETLIEQWRTDVWPELKKRPAWSGARRSLSMNLGSICCPLWCEPMRRAARRPF